jgi:hypothetical protein
MTGLGRNRVSIPVNTEAAIAADVRPEGCRYLGFVLSHATHRAAPGSILKPPLEETGDLRPDLLQRQSLDVEAFI